MSSMSWLLIHKRVLQRARCSKSVVKCEQIVKLLWNDAILSRNMKSIFLAVVKFYHSHCLKSQFEFSIIDKTRMKMQLHCGIGVTRRSDLRSQNTVRREAE